MLLLVAMLGTTLCLTWFIGWLKRVMALVTPNIGDRCAQVQGRGQPLQSTRFRGAIVHAVPGG